MSEHKGGKKNRKFSRCKNSPSHKRYNAENRCEKNKRLRAVKHARRIEKDVIRIFAMIPRGTSRATKRMALQH